ncbi:hypothetical protein CRG98_016454 [Punica granatum]|uniref:Secreted protein n=1 Tax=Punica granatum TaxID=22663 RepID=A0A2I0K403_PUNGR|nr:hypothetical protein CRG98_016454 [Punica granatum]
MKLKLTPRLELAAALLLISCFASQIQASDVVLELSSTASSTTSSPPSGGRRTGTRWVEGEGGSGDDERWRGMRKTMNSGGERGVGAKLKKYGTQHRHFFPV